MIADIDLGSGGVAIGLLLFFLLFGLYFWLCWSIAKYAERKGQNPALFFTLGVLVSPIVSGITALLIRDLRDG